MTEYQTLLREHRAFVEREFATIPVGNVPVQWIEALYGTEAFLVEKARQELTK